MAMSPYMRNLRAVWAADVSLCRPSRESCAIRPVESCSFTSSTTACGGVEFWSESEASDLPLAPWLRGILPRLFEQRSDAWFELPSQFGLGIG